MRGGRTCSHLAKPRAAPPSVAVELGSTECTRRPASAAAAGRVREWRERRVCGRVCGRGFESGGAPDRPPEEEVPSGGGSGVRGAEAPQSDAAGR